MIWVFNNVTEQFMLIQGQPFPLIYWVYAQEKTYRTIYCGKEPSNTVLPVLCFQNYMPEIFTSVLSLLDFTFAVD